METAEDSQEEFEANKVQVLQLAKYDGKLVAPIDLSLESAKPLQLDSLRWANLNKPPFKLKLTNTGSTVLMSGKWKPQRPYIFGGPLNGNYVFSQMHFHWGSDEHEGSEHKVKGICYPMEIHVVFFKSRYLTQEAALRNDDGIVVVVYLVKLLDKTTPSLHLMATHLERIVQPNRSVLLPLLPLASLIVPFTKDYLLYWGSLVSRSQCEHTVLWIISRAPFGINVQDLNIFRNLLDSDNEHMKKNFRTTSPPMGRHIFHVNPSSQTEHLLLRGTVDPVGHTVIVNFSHLPNLSPVEANKILSKGDSTEYEKGKSEYSSNTKRSSSVKANSKTFILNERTYENSTSPPSSYHTYTSSRAGNIKKNREEHRAKSENRNKVMKRKKIEKERKLGLEKIKNKISINSKSSEESIKKLKISLNNTTFKRLLKAKSSDSPIEEKTETEKKNNKDTCGICVRMSSLHLSKHDEALEQVITIKKSDDKTEVNNITNFNTGEKDKNVFKSKLPTPIKINKGELQSSLARYFSKPETVRNHSLSKPMSASSTQEPSERNTVRKQVITSIPRPLGKNAGKFPAGSLESESFERNLHAVTPLQTKRSLTSPVKPIQQSTS